MIHIKNVCQLDGTVGSLTIPSSEHIELDVEGKLTAFPGCIDAHVHLRTPGHTHKEDWRTAAQAAMAGGITTVFDMPNNDPSCVTKERVLAKKQEIDQQLQEIGIPLDYQLWLGAHQNHFNEIGKCKDLVIGVKAYMGSSTGDLLLDDPNALDELFRIAALENMIVAVHAEDEEILEEKKRQFLGYSDPAVHSQIRDRKAAIKATQQVIALTEKYNNQVFIMHVSTKEEIDLIREAKKRELLVYAEVTPHHLFLNESAYVHLGTKAQMNPPLRTVDDQKALCEAIQDGTVDTIGSDHAPHTHAEKNLPYGKAPSGVPGLETTLPLLCQAYHDDKISLEQIVRLTRTNAEIIYDLPSNKDYVLVDLELQKVVDNAQLKTKCGWSPFAGQMLKGWPVMTIVQGKIFYV